MSDSIPASGGIPDSAGLMTATRYPRAPAVAAIPAATTVFPTPVSVPEMIHTSLTVRTGR